MRILVLNAGSSSLKGALWEAGEDPPPSTAPPRIWDARVDWGRHPGRADLGDRSIEIKSPEDAFGPVLDTLPAGRVDVVGHRIVHGGADFRESVVVTPEVRRRIAALGEFAPEHNEIEAEVIDAVSRKLGDVRQVAVFDTAFHATLAPEAYVYPGPYEWLERGIRRYGFHGISYAYVTRRAAETLGHMPERMVACHLGNGCSAAAIRNGRSVDTTMGFTPLEGLMMGTRSGSVDPGILIHLLRGRMPVYELDRVLNKESGLKGLSGVSGDMREVLKAGTDRARLAFDVFVHRLCREIGGMMASLGGMDTLVFTGGIGENSAAVRDAACARLEFASARMLVIPTDEDWEIARECYRLKKS